ncbi:MAG: hypothetical protein ABWY05_17325 [Noviherbaspirillum sp.]
MPAMHVLVDMGNSVLVNAYMETVAGFCGVLPAGDIAGFLACSSNGMPLLHRAMMKGTPDVVRKCISRILAAGLTREEKIGLLAARRQLDGLGAFYLAMSIGDADRAIPFIQGVLTASQLDAAAKMELLQCAKGALPANAGMNESALKVWKRAGVTARAEAERRSIISWSWISTS